MITRRKTKKAHATIRKYIRRVLEKKRNQPINDVCPITQQPFTPNEIFRYVDATGKVQVYDLDAITQWLLTSKTPIDPLTRSRYNDVELKRIDRLNKECKKDHPSVYKTIAKQRDLLLEDWKQVLKAMAEEILKVSEKKIRNWSVIHRLEKTNALEYIDENISGCLFPLWLQAAVFDLTITKEKIVETLQNIKEMKKVDINIKKEISRIGKLILKETERKGLPLRGIEWLDERNEKWYRLLFRNETADLEDLEGTLYLLTSEEFILSIADIIDPE